MRTKWRFLALTTLLCAAIQAQQPAHQHSGDQSPNDPAWSELQSSMEKMHRAMSSIKASGNSDIDFVKMMIPHHQAAIDMAKTQLLFGKDPQLKRLAQEIITDQQGEIDLMTVWLNQHGVNTSDLTQPKSCPRKED
jgi:uncharacterized protein (DUF305 family)